VLAGMPLEILEKIIGFAIPNHVLVRATHDFRPRRLESEPEYQQYGPLEWSHDWVASSILLISKKIRQVARKIVHERMVFHFSMRVRASYPQFRIQQWESISGIWDPDIAREVKRHFKKVLMSDEG
jgi:hypothetical protein